MSQDKPGAPDVDFRIVSESDGVELGRELALHVFVLNRSPQKLEKVSLKLPADIFDVKRPGPTLPPTLAPFGSAAERILVQPRKGRASFGSYRVPIVLDYHWTSPPLAGDSAQQATVGIEVRPPFAEEAKGLPGGTATLFWLLFPVIPAFLAFQIVDRLRKNEGLHVPTFGSEYLVPAFFIALLVHYLLSYAPADGASGAIFQADDPFTIVRLSLLLGALWPGIRWVWDGILQKWWGFDETDPPATYLRKALFSRWSPRPYFWVTGSVGKRTLEGLLLKQPNGKLVLGSTLQISGDEAGERLVEAANRRELRARMKLFWGVRKSTFSVACVRSPQETGQTSEHPGIVITGAELATFQQETSTRISLLRYSP